MEKNKFIEFKKTYKYNLFLFLFIYFISFHFFFQIFQKLNKD